MYRKRINEYIKPAYVPLGYGIFCFVPVIAIVVVAVGRELPAHKRITYDCRLRQ